MNYKPYCLVIDEGVRAVICGEANDQIVSVSLANVELPPVPKKIEPKPPQRNFWDGFWKHVA